MEKTYPLLLTEDELTLLIMGLRYLELHHPGYPEMKIKYNSDFRKLFDKSEELLRQTNFFDMIKKEAS